MLHLSIDTSGVLKELKRFSSEVKDKLEIAMDVAGREIVRMFRDDQLSGRRAPNYGLNKRTGNLYESLRSTAFVKGSGIWTEVYNRGAQYWYYHEYAMGYNPKRLWFDETFRKAGPEVFRSEIETALMGAT